MIVEVEFWIQGKGEEDKGRQKAKNQVLKMKKKIIYDSYLTRYKVERGRGTCSMGTTVSTKKVETTITYDRA